MSYSTTSSIINSLRPDLFTEVYHFNTGESGLAYLGVGVGFLAATLFGVKVSDKIYLHVCQGRLRLCCYLKRFL